MSWRKVLRRSASMFLATGVLLLAVMVWAEGEPGGIPLILIAIGSTGLILSRPPGRGG